MLLDRDALDRSPLDRSGAEATGEFRALISVAVAVSATISNQSANVPITVSFSVSATPTANEASFSAPITVNFAVSVIPTAPAVSFVAAITATIGSLHVIPTGTLNLSELLTGCTIHRSMTDKMTVANFTFDKTSYAGPLSTIYWTKLVMKIPDYAGNWNTVFVGIAPNSVTNVNGYYYGISSPVGNQTVTAYDYSWYLTAQTLEPDDQVLMKWADQQTDYIYRLEYDGVVGTEPTKGDRVWGDLSSDSGTVIENNQASSTDGYMRIKAYLGSTSYFTDDEFIVIGYPGVGTQAYAVADGHAVDDSGTWITQQRYPHAYVERLLGGGNTSTNWGDNWAEMTGIYPYYYDTTSGWTEKEFVFSPQTTKAQAIEELCQYLGYIFYIKFGSVDGYTDIPIAYFIDEDNLDTCGCLPAAVYVTATGDYNAADAGKHMITPFKIEQVGENQYNWVEVRCQSPVTGRWYDHANYNSNVYDENLNSTGTEPKRPYYEVNTNIITQAACTARADDLYTYYTEQVETWTATFTMRSDFVLLQKLIISEFTTLIPDGDYRIIDIQYNYSDSGTKNEVTVKIILDSKFKAYLNLKRVFINSVNEIKNVVKDTLDKLIVSQTGLVLSISANTAVVAIDGTYGTVKRTVSRSGAGGIVPGDRVNITLDSNGNLIATKSG